MIEIVESKGGNNFGRISKADLYNMNDDDDIIDFFLNN